MITRKVYSIHENWLDNIFGEYAPTDDDIRMVEYIIGTNLSDDIDWSGDELFATGEYDYSYDEAEEIWESAVQKAYEVICSM